MSALTSAYDGPPGPPALRHRPTSSAYSLLPYFMGYVILTTMLVYGLEPLFKNTHCAFWFYNFDDRIGPRIDLTPNTNPFVLFLSGAGVALWHLRFHMVVAAVVYILSAIVDNWGKGRPRGPDDLG